MDAVDATVRPYDPTSQHRVMQEHLYGLDLINQSFARHFRVAFFNFIRRGVDVAAESLVYESYQEFADHTPGPASLNLVNMRPLHGLALIVFPADLVDRVVGSLFGGSGSPRHTTDRREFTVTEQRIVRRVLNLALDAYSAAWQVVHPISLTYTRTEVQAKFATITNAPTETVVTSTFRVEIGGEPSELKICLPYAAIEPVRAALANSAPRQQRSSDFAWQQRLRNCLQDATVDLAAEFTTIESTVRALRGMQPGDVLPIEPPPVVTANVAGVPVFTCAYGTHGPHLALQVQERVDRAPAPARDEISDQRPVPTPAADPKDGDTQRESQPDSQPINR